MPQSISRRRFMADSLLGVTAAVGAAYATSATTAVAQQPAGSVAANDKLGVAIMGAGDRARAHINYFRDDARCTILYVVDPDTESAPRTIEAIDQIAESQGGIRPQRVRDLRVALDDKAVDIVASSTTNHWHALSAIWTCQAEKHVYVEKPGNHNIHEGLALVAASKKYNSVVQIGTQKRSMAANADMVKFVHEGGIGEVKFARGLCYKPGRREAFGRAEGFPLPLTVDYDLWSGPAPVVPLLRRNFHYDWHWQRLYGNGDLGNQGSHQTDVACWLLGIDRFPQAVISYGGRLGIETLQDRLSVEARARGDIEVGDVAHTLVSVYDYGDKCIVFETRGLPSTRMDIPTSRKAGTWIGVIAYGTKGYAIQGPTDRAQTQSYSAAYDLEGNVIREFRGGHAVNDHFNNFVDAVVKGDPSAVTAPAIEGSISAAVSHFGNNSYYLGEANKASASEIKAALREIKSLDDNDETVDRTVEHLRANNVDLDRTPMSLGVHLKFDNATGRFIGNDAANAMLTREYRAPYIVPKPEDV